MSTFNRSYIPNSTDWAQESCHFGNPVLISSYQPELDQHQPLDILASYPFPKIELELESDPEPQVGNSISLFDSIMTLVPVHREIESPISYDHTSLMGKVCEHQFFGLDPIFEPILTPRYESRLDLSQFPSRYQFLFLFHLNLNQSSLKITLHCWTRMLKKITQ